MTDLEQVIQEAQDHINKALATIKRRHLNSEVVALVDRCDAYLDKSDIANALEELEGIAERIAVSHLFFTHYSAARENLQLLISLRRHGG